MRRFFQSFAYAWRGIRLCVAERNFRFHLSLTVYMLTYLLLYDWFRLTRLDWAVLIVCIAMVLGTEAINTAIEHLTDLVSPGKHPLAAKAKDAAAGAVLLSSLGAVGAGVSILWQPGAFDAMFSYYQQQPWLLIVLGLSLVLTGVFIIGPNNLNLTETDSKKK
ncbi:MAG: diacylglycerol kinase family protein [Oscillospiraceae bacterium]|jgi:diacylglycerol kinase (ATP)|nr:diacylglycerol kinase family protein [Oscillospiraceae bacterium]